MADIKQRDFSGEFEFRTSRSDGPGGQNVNKTETRVELRFHPGSSRLLSEEEKSIIAVKLHKRISAEGYIIIVSRETRSQPDNKKLCIEKFFKLLEEALKKDKIRKPTKIPRAVQLKRLDDKKKRSDLKQARKKDF